MKKVWGNTHDVVAVDPRQQVGSLNASRDLLRKKKLNKRLRRWKISQTSEWCPFSHPWGLGAAQACGRTLVS